MNQNRKKNDGFDLRGAQSRQGPVSLICSVHTSSGQTAALGGGSGGITFGEF